MQILGRVMLSVAFVAFSGRWKQNGGYSTVHSLSQISRPIQITITTYSYANAADKALLAG